MEKQIYSYDEAYEESLRYFQGDELAARVWVNKYAVKDSFGNIYEKSPEDMHWRIANEVARVESKYPNALTAKELYDLLDHFKYIVPQGSPMTGIGNDYQVASLDISFFLKSWVWKMGMRGYWWLDMRKENTCCLLAKACILFGMGMVNER